MGGRRVVCSLTCHSERLFVRKHSRRCCRRREESSKNEMVTYSASDNTKSEHIMLAAAARTTQTLAARAIRRQTNVGLQASRPVASESRGLARSWSARRRCGRVRVAWVLGLCVQSSVMSDNDQFTTPECAKPTCNHPFDSIQRADSHSTHATSTISVGTGRCGVPSVCVESYSFEPRADAEW